MAARPLLVALAVLALLPAYFTATGNTYPLTQLIMATYATLAVVGMCLLLGYAGQVSLGHAGFIAIGGYTTALLTTLDLQPHLATPLVRLLDTAGCLVRATTIYGTAVVHCSPWLALAVALLLTAGIALLIGMPILRLHGHYLAMATLGFGFIIYRIVLATRALGEADGLTGVPAFHLAGGLAVTRATDALLGNYAVASGILLASVVLIGNLLASRHGRALCAIHDAEGAAAAMGIDVPRYKLFAFVLSAQLAALAGFLQTHFSGGIGPTEASVMHSVRLVAILAVGGMRSLWGTLAAGLLLNFLSLRGTFGTYDDFVFGAVLIVAMLFRPDGLFARRRPTPADGRA